MGTRIPSHQLSNGLHISKRQDQHKERQPTTGSRAAPTTGDDLKKSGGVRERRSGQLEPSGSMGKVVYGSSLTSLNEEAKFRLKVSKAAMWVFLVVAGADLSPSPSL